MFLPAASAGAQERQTFVPPRPNFTADRQLEVLRLELSEGSVSEAALRAEQLLAASPDALTDHGGSIRSLRRWVTSLPPEDVKKLSEAWEAQFGREAQAALRQVIGQTRNAGPEAAEAFYAVYRRYPLSQAGVRARELAAERVALLGDDQAAAVLRGDSVQTPPTFAVLSRPTWFSNRREEGPELRSLPVADLEHVYIADEAHVMKLRHGGLPIWLFDATTYYGSPNKPGTPARDLQPALLLDANGVAQVVVVRQPSADGNRFVLRALRAEDGMPLWDGEGSGRPASALSNPVVAGRYVYAIVAEDGVSGSRMLAVAVDVVDGREVWRAALGQVVQEAGGRRRGNPNLEALDALWQEPADPAVDGDLLIINTHGGSVMALDRFDGRIEWVSNYDQLDLNKRGRLEREAHKEALRRWSAQPAVAGDLVAVAPRDTPAIFGIRRNTGQRLWQSGDKDAASLVGVVGNVVVVAREGVYALGGESGEMTWELHPKNKAGGSNRGPTAVIGDVVVMPLGGTAVHAVQGTDGQEVSPPTGRVIQLSDILANPEAVKRLGDAGMLVGLGVPTPKP
ncbi:MAG: PQQ-binding-like beta-propeller repeat protein [Phycisphaerae bacterium]